MHSNIITNKVTLEEEEAFQQLEERQAQEEAHQHFLIKEANELILSLGPTTFLNKLSKEARDELIATVIHGYVKRKVEASIGL